ncbi:MAG: STT3 domain-containing protein [Nanoarchaeota archaeon]|nr:STT3 domain-containing protein [Nanoarchaeota archaeon]
MEEHKELEERERKIFNYFKEKTNWVVYLILAGILYINFYIRTLNIPGLKDVTTGGWTLGPDLDPFLFLRWTKNIVANGSLMATDMMRNVPLGFDTTGEMKLFPYMIAWLHYALQALGLSNDVTYSAILFPVFAATFTVIAFFLFTRKVFYKEDSKTRDIIALVAAAFLVVMPAWLPRSVAGIPEKESLAFGLMFLAFYFIIGAFIDKGFVKRLAKGIGAGISTALMGLIWGGVIFVFYVIGASFIIYFFYGKIKKEEIYIYAAWLVTSFALMAPFSTRYSIKVLLLWTPTLFALGALILIILSMLVAKNKTIKKFSDEKKIPLEICAFITSSIIILILGLIILGPSFYLSKVSEIGGNLVNPSSNRFEMTVAENKQPYYAPDWKNSFGPVVAGIPVYFWLFMLGAVLLFYNLGKEISSKKRNKILTFLFFIFLITFIFSRTSQNSIFSGDSQISLIVYAGGFLLFVTGLVYYYIKDKREGFDFSNANFGYILYIVLFILSMIGARGGIRLIMFLGNTSPLLVAFLLVIISKKAITDKGESKMFFALIAIFLIISGLFAFYYDYNVTKSTAESYVPGGYNQQWQKAMGWVRENTTEEAVFAHWWDYGYWVQTLGERATVLDGGNKITYWNHLLGRHVLTTPDRIDSLEFMYSHNVTNLLIDSSDIGKYTAFSSIGSNENYDRYSWIQDVPLNAQQSYQQDNLSYYVYSGGIYLDDDIIWNQNGTQILLPKRKAAVGAVIVPSPKKGEYLQPTAVVIYNSKQYQIPLQYIYVENKLINFESGLHAGIFIYPSLEINSNGQAGINNIGASLYLSNRTVDSSIAQLYLFGRSPEGFKLAHTEESPVVKNIKDQLNFEGDFIYYQGLQGPIKIWDISYPKNITYHPEYLETQFPNDALKNAKPGEY